MEPDQILFFCFNNHIKYLYELVIKTVADYHHHHYYSSCIICTIIINLILEILEISSQHQSKAKIKK